MAKDFKKTTTKLTPERKSLDELSLEDPKAQILSMCLYTAVSMEVVRIHQNELEMGSSLTDLIDRERENNCLIEQEAAFFIKIAGKTPSPCGWG